MVCRKTGLKQKQPGGWHRLLVSIAGRAALGPWCPRVHYLFYISILKRCKLYRVSPFPYLFRFFTKGLQFSNTIDILLLFYYVLLSQYCTVLYCCCTVVVPPAEFSPDNSQYRSTLRYHTLDYCYYCCSGTRVLCVWVLCITERIAVGVTLVKE